MLSNVYIARGERDGVPVMKVGKANNIRQRQNAIGITIEMSIPQLDEAAAFDLETQLRLFVLTHGGKRLLRTNDWFYFDSRIYAALCTIVADLNADVGDTEVAPIRTEYNESEAAKIAEDAADAEIEALRERYHRLLADEAEQNAERMRRLQSENKERLKGEKAARHSRFAGLQRELDELSKEFAAASERFCEEKDNPKEFLPQAIWELNGSIVRLEAQVNSYRLFL
jgi:hypothetical protein